MTKKDDETFENSTTCKICDNIYVDDDVKLRDHCHITVKYQRSAQRDCNIKVKLNHNILATFHKLKNYDSHLIIQELGIISIKRHINWIKNYMSFNINKKLILIASDF